jgi:hypothetical protein
MPLKYLVIIVYVVRVSLGLLLLFPEPVLEQAK